MSLGTALVERALATAMGRAVRAGKPVTFRGTLDVKRGSWGSLYHPETFTLIATQSVGLSSQKLRLAT